jgi:aryl-alcohol dehydrogenase (NADP+)
MEHTRLGRTGLLVSRVCLGTMTFGDQADESTSRRILDVAAEAGVRFIDTADIYPPGGSESVGRAEAIVGRWLTGKREEFIVATKCAHPTGPRPWDRGMSRKHILDAIDSSLRRLQTDYVDLYQLHTYDSQTPLDEALDALDTVVRQGKARYFGVSNWLAYQVALSIGRSQARGLARVECVQPRYNLLFRRAEEELLPLCEQERIGVIPYNPLAGGLLTGKHDRRGAPAEGTRFALRSVGRGYQNRYWHERDFDLVESLTKVAAEASLTMPALALGWVLANPTVTAAIVGASRPEQLLDSLAAADAPLDPVLKGQLDEISYVAP